MNKTLFLIPAFLLGCSTIQSNHAVTTSSIEPMQRIKVAAQRKQDAKDRQLVMNKKNNLNKNLLKNVGAVPQKGGKLSFNMGKPVANMTEMQMYSEITDRYESHDQLGFNKVSQLFFKKYKNSHKVDDVLYMKGLLELGDKNYGVALVQFNKIIREHPNSHKVSAALFAKGMTYRKMNLIKEARVSLTKVTTDFSGSPESTRAQAELKTL